MKKKLVAVMLALALTLSACSSASAASDVAENKENEAVVSETVETPQATELEEHAHVYMEEMAAEADCENDGVKTYTCDCGDYYTEVITAKGHLYENYVYNEDATYLVDGTETSTCRGCDLTDTRIVEGTKLEYTYVEMSATKYVKKSVNVRSLPCTDGEKLGSLDMNDKVIVTGQCNETKWYCIEFDGSVAYVSNNYLVDEKVVVATPPATPTAPQLTSSENAGNNNAETSQEQPVSEQSPQPTPEQAPTDPTPSEPVKNPNGYKEVTSAEYWTGNLPPGDYYLVDTDQTVTIDPPIDMGQSESKGGTIIDGDTGEIINP